MSSSAAHGPVPVPPVPAASVLRSKILTATWAAERPLMRAHPHLFGSSEFDRRLTQFRFSPLHFAARQAGVAYCGQDDAAVLSETVFHTVPDPSGSIRPRQVFLSKYLAWQWSPVQVDRDLTLIRLDEDGLDALGLTRAELIEADQRSYRGTAAWGQALLEAEPRADGLLWYSRQAPDKQAVLLVEATAGRSGGIKRTALSSPGPSVAFLSPAGLERLDQVGEDLDVTVLRP